MRKEKTPPKFRKRFGQHFLQDNKVIENIISSINLKERDHIVEIGPGLGALTEKLLDTNCQMDAVEVDRDLAKKLNEKFSKYENFKLHLADALSFKYETHKIEGGKMRVVGNLPYNISTQLIFKLFDIIDSVEDMHFMLQLEVVQRLTASPGEKAWGRLAILAQYHCEVTHLFNVPPNAFKPIPKVQSAVVRLKPLQQKPFQHVESLALSNATRLAFSQRRKTLRNNLKSVIDVDRLKDIEINPEARAETLTLRQFIKLAKFIHAS